MTTTEYRLQMRAEWLEYCINTQTSWLAEAARKYSEMAWDKGDGPFMLLLTEWYSGLSWHQKAMIGVPEQWVARP